MEYKSKHRKIRYKNNVFTRVSSGTLQGTIKQDAFISSDYRYNNHETGIEPHICKSYIFDIRDKAIIAMGRYFIKYAYASIHSDVYKTIGEHSTQKYPLLLANSGVWIMVLYKRYTYCML